MSGSTRSQNHSTTPSPLWSSRSALRTMPSAVGGVDPATRSPSSADRSACSLYSRPRRTKRESSRSNHKPVVGRSRSDSGRPMPSIRPRPTFAILSPRSRTDVASTRSSRLRAPRRRRSPWRSRRTQVDWRMPGSASAPRLLPPLGSSSPRRSDFRDSSVRWAFGRRRSVSWPAASSIRPRSSRPASRSRRRMTPSPRQGHRQQHQSAHPDGAVRAAEYRGPHDVRIVDVPAPENRPMTRS